MTTPIIIAFGTILSDATVGLGYGFNLTQYVIDNFAQSDASVKSRELWEIFDRISCAPRLMKRLTGPA